MVTVRGLLTSRARSYLLLLSWQIVFIFAGVVGSACSDEYSPSPTYSVPNPEERAPDGGVKVGSKGLGSDVILKGNAKFRGKDTEITWEVLDPRGLIVVPVRDPKTGDLKLTIAKGSAKPPGATIRLRGRYTGRTGDASSDVYALRVKVE